MQVVIFLHGAYFASEPRSGGEVSTSNWNALMIALIGAMSSGCGEKQTAPAAKMANESLLASQTTKYLGDNAKAVNWLVLRPTGAVVLLKAPCGAQSEYFKATAFAYEGKEPSPTASRKGCYRFQPSEHSSNLIHVVDSDGVVLGGRIVDVSTDEAFGPENYFLPLDNDPRRQWPQIEALGVAVLQFNNEPSYETIGLTRQSCPVDKSWYLARHIPQASADDYEGCWREVDDQVEVRSIDYMTKPLKLTETGLFVSKDAFFDATTIHATPLKYAWK